MNTDTISVAAIVPVYNEGVRVRPVIDALLQCSDIQEVIIVDDGSREPLTWVQKEYPRVKFIRHERNLGKGAAMETGSGMTRARFIFFCDADLVGFLPEHASAMIRPVVSGAYRMFLGIRANPAQQSVFIFALNSGERCLLRSDWQALPRFYKRGFRVETGLNFFVKRRGGQFGYKAFSYRQIAKEKKYPIMLAIRQRIHMLYEVGTAWLRIFFVDARHTHV